MEKLSGWSLSTLRGGAAARQLILHQRAVLGSSYFSVTQ